MNWLFYAILGALLMGASPVFAKNGMYRSNSHLAAALRGIFLFLGTWFAAVLTGEEISLFTIEQTSLFYLLFSGLATGIAWICLLRALQLGEVIKVIPVVEVSVVLNILMDIFLFQEKWTWNKSIIMLLLVAGAVLMGYKKSKGRSNKTSKWISYAIGAILFTAVTTVLEQIGYAEVPIDTQNVLRYGIACVVAWGFVFATKAQKALRSLTFLNGVSMCMSGIVMVGSWYCFDQAFAKGKEMIVAVVERADFVAAVALGVLFLGERMSTYAIAGMVLMMLAFGILLADLPIIPL